MDLSEPAAALVDETTEILPFIDKLTGQNLLLDALRVIAVWLTKRKALWWAVHCVESACADRLQAQESLLTLARTWVEEPTEEKCLAALQAAELTDTKLPACWLARAVSWSGASLAPPDLPAVPPGEQLCAQGVMAALLLAAVFVSPAKSGDNYRRFIEQGKQLSQTKLEWELTDNSP